jgi:hypothetical protein
LIFRKIDYASIILDDHLKACHLVLTVMGFVFFSNKGRDKTMLTEARQLSLFGNDLKAMDLMIEKFKMIVNKYIRRGKKNLFAVIEHLRKFSCKTRGVSFCKVATMAQALGISERTIQRIISRLVDLGLVKKIPMIDKKTGTQWPNCYQLQSEIDWTHIVDSLAPDLVAMNQGGSVDPADTQNVTHDDTRNVTPSTSEKPMVHKRSWNVPAWGSFSKAFKSIKNINESKEEMIQFPFYNWLENSVSKHSVQQNRTIQLPDYLLR